MPNFDWDLFEHHYNKSTGSLNDFSPLPTGEYRAIVKQNQYDPTKAQFVRKFEITDGEYFGKVQTDWIRLFKNDGSPIPFSADRIKSEIKLLDPAAASMAFLDVSPLYCQATIDKPVLIKVSTKPGKKADGSETLNCSVFIQEFLTAESALPF